MFLACVVRSMVCLSEKLYVIGGEREEDHRELKLEWSNSEEDKWIRTQPCLAALAGMTESRFLMAVYLNSPKGVLDKLKVVK